MPVLKQRLTLISEEVRKRAIVILQSLPLDPCHDLLIQEHKKDISAEQRALYFVWMGIIGGSLGESKEEMHERYKDRFLVNIYERDDEDYAEMIQALRNVYTKGMKQEALALRKRIVALTSITVASSKQMSELMTLIEHDAASLAIRLPFPEENS
jgi:hypothetical protein